MRDARYFYKQSKVGDATCKTHASASLTSATATRYSECSTDMEVTIQSKYLGPEVSKYVERIFVQQLTTNKLYKEQKYKEAMVETFRRVD